LRGRRNLDGGIEPIVDPEERRGAAREAWRVLLDAMLLGGGLTLGTLLLP
jgi:hypothetical protein